MPDACRKPLRRHNRIRQLRPMRGWPRFWPQHGTAFAEKGFDGASMQDLARAAGMSVGNFYRYFASKAAIVQALIALDLEEMARDFLPIFASDDPIATMRQQVRHQTGRASMQP